MQECYHRVAQQQVIIDFLLEGEERKKVTRSTSTCIFCEQPQTLCVKLSAISPAAKISSPLPR